MGAAILISALTFVLVYITTFKDDFKKEDIDKVTPFLVGIALLIIITSILSSI